MKSNDSDDSFTSINKDILKAINDEYPFMLNEDPLLSAALWREPTNKSNNLLDDGEELDDIKIGTLEGEQHIPFMRSLTSLT